MIPFHERLPINLLKASFNNTAAAYKFYWFLSILEEVERGEYYIPKHRLFVVMVATSWYTINYFNVSFGKQDQLHKAVGLIALSENLTIDEDRSRIKKQLNNSTNRETLKALWHFNKQVPHRFLSPWFPAKAENSKFIYQASSQFENDCLYAVDETHITINPVWVNYLMSNIGVLKDFCYWNLSLYLQKHNPNVPDIPNKLIKPAKRNGLLKQRNCWNMVIAELGGVDCIYTNSRLHEKAFAVEHFIPYAFVSHDLFWNLIPANPKFNSSKSDKLPKLDKYFDAFYHLQKQAIEIIKAKSIEKKILEDYLSIFPDLDQVDKLPDSYKGKFRTTIEPLITIASNNGFEFMVC
ncbi:HNH endonuclease domain-containing protein [Pedobacter soli]|uniref:HNH endonuclease n=1 Tax=Pedobacter soli TaxID=390242 RepID=A0A1G6Q2S0_9SPHI|nr:HNH endonuclease domain-containing protein [Pedobacter soli]SDC86653.1 HNH endonuclease [Pedobacter soli]